MAGVSPDDPVGTAAGVPAVDGLNMLPVLLGTNRTSPRSEIFFGKEALIQGDWKLLSAKASSASWPGPTYPNRSTAATNNTLDNYNLECSDTEPCLFNVVDDMTEHDDVSAANPSVVAKMQARRNELLPTVWSNKWTGYESSCIPTSKAIAMYGGFVGPFCELGTLPPPPPPPPTPGPFPPTPLTNCSYLPNTWVSPATSIVVNASTEEACCSACGMSADCVASVLQCDEKGGSGSCTCKLKPYNPSYHLSHTTNDRHTTLTCITGRQHIPDGP
jgi:hypothetical protein